VSNRCVAPGWYVLRLRQPAIADAAAPGQFVQILCGGGASFDPLLRRPFSVYRVDRDAGTYDVLYTVVGRGTRWMAGLGDPSAASDPQASCVRELDVLGPLGNTFTPPSAGERIYLIGGGVGLAPLYFFAQRLLESSQTPEITFCAGARSAELLSGIDEFRALPVRAEIATDDGSAGFHGRVTELFVDLLERDGSDPNSVRVYGCGPQPMNDALRALTVERGLRCEICLESLMACGFGICFGCVAPIRHDPASEFENRRICRDGPVFDATLLREGIAG